MSNDQPARFAPSGLSFCEVPMFVPQVGVAILETDHALTDKQSDKIKASLRLLGVEAEILPCGITLGAFVQTGMSEDDDD